LGEKIGGEFRAAEIEADRGKRERKRNGRIYKKTCSETNWVIQNDSAGLCFKSAQVSKGRRRGAGHVRMGKEWRRAKRYFMGGVNYKTTGRM
jgi:hypothetical protein